MNWADIAVLIVIYSGLQALYPDKGPLGWLRKLTAAQQREETEAALKHLHDCEWRGAKATLESLSGSLGISSRKTLNLVGRLEAQGLVDSTELGLQLTVKGEQIAVQIIRAHRLWERYLAHVGGMGLLEVHSEASKFDRDRSSESLAAIEAELGYPRVDPHGEPIPREDGTVDPPSGNPLNDWPIEKQAEIVRIEDEPEAILAQIVAQGLGPGARVRILKKNKGQLVLWDGCDTHRLAPVVAANIYVEELLEQSIPEGVTTLDQLQPGESGRVYDLSHTIHGFSRRRMLDLGMTAGTKIECELRNVFGDPTGYRVRGTLIALRSDAASHVLIEKNGD